MKNNSRLKIIVGMPAYNEERYIGSLVLATRQHANEVIVIDDGSTDNTSKIAGYAGATVFRHDTRTGKGAAIQRILEEVKKRDPDILVLMDADFQHDPQEIPDVIKPIMDDGYDLVIGSRAGQAEKTPRYRRVGQKIILNTAHFLFRKNLADSESGFRALSRKAISEIRLTENGFAVETEMLAEAAEKKLKFTEVPISNIYTPDGSTKHPLAHGFEVLSRIAAMISERRPLLFFGAGGALLVVFGLIFGVRVLNIMSHTGLLPIGTALVSTVLLIVGMFSIFSGIILHILVKRRV